LWGAVIHLEDKKLQHNLRNKQFKWFIKIPQIFERRKNLLGCEDVCGQPEECKRCPKVWERKNRFKVLFILGLGLRRKIYPNFKVKYESLNTPQKKLKEEK
jgi:hypothetical protein